MVCSIQQLRKLRTASCNDYLKKNMLQVVSFHLKNAIESCNLFCSNYESPQKITTDPKLSLEVIT